jgi:hypothetical protein
VSLEGRCLEHRPSAFSPSDSGLHTAFFPDTEKALYTQFTQPLCESRAGAALALDGISAMASAAARGNRFANTTGHFGKISKTRQVFDFHW